MIGLVCSFYHTQVVDNFTGALVPLLKGLTISEQCELHTWSANLSVALASLQCRLSSHESGMLMGTEWGLCH